MFGFDLGGYLVEQSLKIQGTETQFKRYGVFHVDALIFWLNTN